MSLLFARTAYAIPVVTMDATKVLNFPAKDLSLFSHVSNFTADQLTTTWTKTSGPAGPIINAPWGQATTVSFTTSGTYTFQLAATDNTGTGTASITVTVKDASTQTAFYVDMSYTGCGAAPCGTGTAGDPWNDFNFQGSLWTAQMNALNAALATNDVIVYFAPVLSDGVTQQQITNAAHPGQVTFQWNRTDTSTHYLTFDGMTLYRQSGSTWISNPGTTKFKINQTSGASAGMACCYDPRTFMDYVRVRGFELTGAGARLDYQGSYTTVEYMFIHDLTALDPAVLFQGSLVDGGCQFVGISHDITFRNNVEQRTDGDGIYLQNNYNIVADGGCLTPPNNGDGHYDFLVEGNSMTDTGINGGQGGGVNIKPGIYNITVRNNDVGHTHSGPPGACGGGNGVVPVLLMPASTHPSNLLIENNTFHDFTCDGSDAGNGIQASNINGAVFRNNIVYNGANGANGSSEGITMGVREDGVTPNNKNIRIYNNTFYNLGGGIALANFDDTPVIYNNLFISMGTHSINTAGVASITSDYNLFRNVPTPEISEGNHSDPPNGTNPPTSTTGIVVALGSNFHLAMNSPAIGLGLNLISTGFVTDKDGVNRPTGVTPWDAGVYQFAAPPPPSGLAQLFIFGVGH